MTIRWRPCCAWSCAGGWVSVVVMPTSWHDMSRRSGSGRPARRHGWRRAGRLHRIRRVLLVRDGERAAVQRAGRPPAGGDELGRVERGELLAVDRDAGEGHAVGETGEAARGLDDRL